MRWLAPHAPYFLRIWLVKFDETLPIDRNPRLYRMGMLADALVAAGHEVVWWASTFDHNGGRLRFSDDTVCSVTRGYELRLLHTIRGYSRAVSGTRAVNNFRQAVRFLNQADSAARPHAIVCAMPTPELAWVSARLCERYGVPLVLDARDMWPDIFADLLSPVARVAAWPYTTLMRATLRSAARKATSCTAITEPFLDWIVSYAGRQRRPTDVALPLGYQEPKVDAAESEAASAALQVGPRDSFNVIFLGRLNRTVLDAFDPVVEAVRNLRHGPRPFRFYFAGAGDCAAEIRSRAAECPEIIFLGHVTPPVMAVLKRRAHAALLCIARRRDYQISLSNKVFDYLSAGLPLISHISGLVGELLSIGQCGLVYDNGIELTKILEKLSANEAVRSEMGLRARKIFCEQFEAETVYAKYTHHITNVVKAAQVSKAQS